MMKRAFDICASTPGVAHHLAASSDHLGSDQA